MLNTMLLTVDAQFSSVLDGIYELGKSHMRSTPSLRSFRSVAFCSSCFPLTEDHLCRPFEGRASSASSFCRSRISAVLSLSSCPLYEVDGYDDGSLCLLSYCFPIGPSFAWVLLFMYALRACVLCARVCIWVCVRACVRVCMCVLCCC